MKRSLRNSKSSDKPCRKPSGRSRQPKSNGHHVGQEAELPMTLDRHEMVELVQESLHSFAIEIGLLVAGKLLDDEIQQLCGPRHTRQTDRQTTRFGRQPGYIVLGGQKIHLERPRARYTDGRGEVSLELYQQLQDPQSMPEAALRRMVRGVSCRDYEDVVDQARNGFGVKKSSVSRSFVKASAEDVEALAKRRFDDERWVAIFIDGVQYAGETMICALGLSSDGHKKLLGLRQGATENAEVVTALLEELCERGVAADQPTLFVLDGAKALYTGVKKVWGKRAVIQRCQIHKKRNVKAHVPQKHWPRLLEQLNAAYYTSDHQAALKQLKDTARRLDRISPDAAASLREGMEETLTVIRLGVPELLRKTLSSTNPIESAFDVASTVTSRVKRWRDGNMRQRWCTAGLLKAESRFRRVKGYKQIPVLVQALQELIDAKKKAG